MAEAQETSVEPTLASPLASPLEGDLEKREALLRRAGSSALRAGELSGTLGAVGIASAVSAACVFGLGVAPRFADSAPALLGGLGILVLFLAPALYLALYRRWLRAVSGLPALIGRLQGLDLRGLEASLEAAPADAQGESLPRRLWIRARSFLALRAELLSLRQALLQLAGPTAAAGFAFNPLSWLLAVAASAASALLAVLALALIAWTGVSHG